MGRVAVLDIIIMAIVGAAIGWFTNHLAIRMLFRPLVPWKLPLIGIELQGLIPKRRRELAVSIGLAVEQQLFSASDIVNRLVEGENKQEIISGIRHKVLNVIEEKIPSIIPGAIRNAIVSKIGSVFDKEIEGMFDSMMEDNIHKAVSRINIREIVEEKLNSLDLMELESLILEIMGRELKYIEVLGGVLGLLIGIMQGLLLLFI